MNIFTKIVLLSGQNIRERASMFRSAHYLNKIVYERKS